jgi:hypothetical protein
MPRSSLTTQIVIDCAKSAITQYNDECNAFGIFSRPGKEGVTRKLKLVSYISSLTPNSSAAKALIDLANFCEAEKNSSRLQKILKTRLMGLFGITIPDYSHENQLVYPQLVKNRLADFDDCIQKIKDSSGIQDSCDVPLSTFRSS